MIWVRAGAFFMLAAVTLGAFGAHALAARLEPKALQTFETGARYLAYHGLGLLVIGALARDGLGSWVHAAGLLACVGAALFSGSLFWLALGGPRWLGPVTPLGGLALIGGWAALLVATFRTHA